MSPPADILLIANADVARHAADTIGAARCLCYTDPYQALDQLDRHPWRMVVIVGSGQDVAELAAAIHRARGDTRILGLCPADDIKTLKPLVGDPLVGCFTFPPSPRELQRLRKALPEPPGPAGVTTAPPPSQTSPEVMPEPYGPLDAGELMELVRAAVSMDQLERALVDCVGRKLGCGVQWHNAEDASGRVLLHIDDAPARVLLPEGRLESIHPDDHAYLHAVQSCMPGLVAAATRLESMVHLATTDHLTGACNRRHFYFLTDSILRRMAEQHRPVTLLLFDIDDFKHYNDTYGHAAGDEILRETVTMMTRTMRDHDVIARIGGDEFTVVLWDDSPPRQADSQPVKTALTLIERFRATLAGHEFDVLGHESRGSLTMSGGVAVFPDDGADCRALLRSADRALRRAKQSGKDLVYLVGDADE
ncbi:MAG: GGDEF domain-containing protein [Planctomycetota bacterium]|jgi:diguanylate cyclase (GGDEF)-like protein